MWKIVKISRNFVDFAVVNDAVAAAAVGDALVLEYADNGRGCTLSTVNNILTCS